ncbi:MAG: 4-oxalocrotonate tautomerase family protein [Saprospiraceae bacterium]|nr:4-oxalocrotonate tautomerase family protein [Saprospiraceae bacterium]
MPLVNVKLFKNEYSPEESEALIKKITDVIVSFSGEQLRDATWVVIEEVKDGQWGVGGNALSLEDVREMQKS